MSFCTGLLRRLFEAALVFTLITFLPGIPPDMQFTAYSVTESRDLVGPLELNDKLNRAEHLFENEIRSPEGFAVANNTLYTGLSGGDICKLKGDKLIPVANIAHPCAGAWDEKNCGRPLGMQFDRHGMLYVVDAYYGIYKVNVNTGTKLHLIATDKPIEGKIPKIANSVAVSRDNTVYWTVSSCDVTLQDGLLTMFGDGTGRVFKYDPITKVNTLLLDNIHFANGIALSTKEDFIVVAETVRHRLLRIWLTGPKKGTSEVFVDGLPGMPDNLRPNGKGGFYVSLILPRTKEMPALSDLLGPHPIVRRFLARLLCIFQAPFELVQRHFPNYYTGTINYWINHFEMFTPLMPKALMILDISETGEIVESLQSTNKAITSVSDLVFVDQTYYLGSPFNKFLGRVKTRIPIHVKVDKEQPPQKQS